MKVFGFYCYVLFVVVMFALGYVALTTVIYVVDFVVNYL